MYRQDGRPYSHKDQEGLQEPLNRHGGPPPAGGGVLKENSEEICSWKIFISVTIFRKCWGWMG